MKLSSLIQQYVHLNSLAANSVAWDFNPFEEMRKILEEIDKFEERLIKLEEKMK